MLTDEQIKILKIGDRGIVRIANDEREDEYVGSWCRHVVYFAGELATALLARQRLRDQLQQAQRGLTARTNERDRLWIEIAKLESEDEDVDT